MATDTDRDWFLEGTVFLLGVCLFIALPFRENEFLVSLISDQSLATARSLASHSVTVAVG